MFNDLPKNARELLRWTWTAIEPYYADLAGRPLHAENLPDWLADWSAISARVDELYNRLYVATTIDTTDAGAEQRYNRFLDEIYPAAQTAEDALKRKLLASGLAVSGFEIPLRNMRAEADLFRPHNVPLLAQEQKLVSEYSKILGAQTVNWQGHACHLQDNTSRSGLAKQYCRERLTTRNSQELRVTLPWPLSARGLAKRETFSKKELSS